VDIADFGPREPDFPDSRPHQEPYQASRRTSPVHGDRRHMPFLEAITITACTSGSFAQTILRKSARPPFAAPSSDTHHYPSTSISVLIQNGDELILTALPYWVAFRIIKYGLRNAPGDRPDSPEDDSRIKIVADIGIPITPKRKW